MSRTIRTAASAVLLRLPRSSLASARLIALAGRFVRPNFHGIGDRGGRARGERGQGEPKASAGRVAPRSWPARSSMRTESRRRRSEAGKESTTVIGPVGRCVSGLRTMMR